ncbi:hypothetical protein [Psychrobacillus sp. NPDC096623]|uniref:hypothetical protein n=1 Tax=Psychrobacillus sp. NPDC096623 TaxID=3364492 RepID=UPI003815B570
MKKTKLIISMLSGVILLSACFWYYKSDPTSFPNDEQLVKEMTNHFSYVSNSEIQDTIFLDDRHVFVPFQAEEKLYGLSLWEWKNRKWNVVLVSTSGDIKVWKINSKDPSTFHTVWNYPPQKKVKYMKLYLINKRGFQISGAEEQYEPGVQLEQKITLSENPYGTMKLSKDWITVINSLTGSLTLPQYYFRWNAYDSLDKITYPEVNDNGSSSWGGATQIEFAVFIEESELE